MGLQILDPRFKSGWRLQKKRHASACLFFRVSFSETPMAKIENRERKPRRRGLHVARGDFSCSASQNHRAFICCTSFPNRACSVGLRSADCRCQPGYCTAACMKNCAPDGAQFLNVRISSTLLVLLRQHGHALGARLLPHARALCAEYARLSAEVGALPGRAHISAATRQFLRYLDRRNAPEVPAGCTGFDNQA